MAHCSSCGCSSHSCSCTRTSPFEMIMGMILLTVMLAIAAVVMLAFAPGMLLNLILGRFADHPDGFITASLTDTTTWVVSAVFWGVVYVKGKERLERLVQYVQQKQRTM